MTSPLPPQFGSSPFPFPLPGISPFPAQSTTNPPNHPAATFNFSQLTASPNPFSIPSNPPTNVLWPGTSPVTTIPSFQPTLTVSTDEPSEFGNLKVGLEGFSQGLERCLVVLSEIKRMEEGLFHGDTPRSEGMEVGLGGLSRLELLHLEYTQLLSTLIALSTSTHLSSLPCPISQSIPKPAQLSDPQNPSLSDTTMSDSSRRPTLDEIILWAETQANLEFSRREAVRIGAKTVLDVLSKR